MGERGTFSKPRVRENFLKIKVGYEKSIANNKLNEILDEVFVGNQEE